MKARNGADRRPAVRLQVLVSGSYMEVQCTANQAPLVKFGIVPIADDGFPEIPARYPTLDVTFDSWNRWIS
jgi:hypothetical protein